MVGSGKPEGSGWRQYDWELGDPGVEGEVKGIRLDAYLDSTGFDTVASQDERMHDGQYQGHCL